MTLYQAGIEDVCTSTVYHMLSPNSPRCSQPTGIAGDGYSQLQYVRSPATTTSEEAFKDRFSELLRGSTEFVVGGHSHENMTSYPFQEAQALYEPGTGRLTEAALKARNERNDEMWLSGVKYMTEMAQCNVGVIGDKRL
jgi:hypothetical protein